MTTHLLITDEMKATMPETVKELFNYGRIHVVFPPVKKGDPSLSMFGDNAVVVAEPDVMIKWLKPFDSFAVGNGSPQMECFEIMHIKENL